MKSDPKPVDVLNMMIWLGKQRQTRFEEPMAGDSMNLRVQLAHSLMIQRLLDEPMLALRDTPKVPV